MANGTFDELVGGGWGEMAVVQCLGCGGCKIVVDGGELLLLWVFGNDRHVFWVKMRTTKRKRRLSQRRDKRRAKPC